MWVESWSVLMLLGIMFTVKLWSLECDSIGKSKVMSEYIALSMMLKMRERNAFILPFIDVSRLLAYRQAGRLG